jgi:hypothetical protein
MYEESITMAKERKTPVEWRLVANIRPLINPPSVCPTSIIVSRNPIAAPTSSSGTSSQISGDVVEVTVAKPKP